MSRVRLRAGVLVAVLLAMSVVGCTTAAPPSGGANGNGTLVISIAGDPKVFNTNHTFDNYAYYTDRNIYSRLVGYDYLSSEPFGDLATSWTVAPDMKSVTFKLRTGVKWHDGQPFSSADVVFSYQDVLAAAEAAYSWTHVKNVDSVTAPDAETVVFTLKEPDATFIQQISNYYAPIILPKHIYDGSDVAKNPANQKPVGTGPFKFVSQTIGDRVVMERNPDYYGTKASFQTLVFRVIPNRATAMAALKAGEIGYSTASPAFGDAKSFETDGNIKVEKTISHIIQWMGFNLDNPILAKPEVRKAIAHAVDTKQVNEQAYLGYATPSTGTYVSYSWAYDPNALQPAFDTAEAERQLDAAGYPRKDGGYRFDLSFVAFNASIFGGPESAEVVKQQLDKIGIRVTIDLIDVAVLNQQVFKDRKFDLVTIAGLAGPNPQAFANFVGTGGSLNPMPYSNPDVDKAFADARATSDQDAQKALYSQIQQAVARDLPRVNLVEYPYLRPHRAQLDGFWWQEGAGDKGIFLDMYNGVTGVGN